jgi:type IV pilus assembly protein PilF
MSKVAETEISRKICGLLCLASIVLVTVLGCVPQGFTGSEEIRKTAEAHYQIGINYLGEGKTPQALKEFLAAQALSPKNADIEHALGLAYQQKGLTDQAIQQYNMALNLDPKLTEARNNLGTALLMKGQYDEAIAQFELCLKDNLYATPDKAAYNLGLAYYKKKDLDKSVQYYQKAVQLKGDNVNAMYNLAYILEEKRLITDWACCTNDRETAPKVWRHYKRPLGSIPITLRRMFGSGQCSSNVAIGKKA